MAGMQRHGPLLRQLACCRVSEVFGSEGVGDAARRSKKDWFRSQKGGIDSSQGVFGGRHTAVRSGQIWLVRLLAARDGSTLIDDLDLDRMATT